MTDKVSIIYKIVTRDGKFLYKGHNRSREIPFFTWLKAEEKKVRDKYPDGKEYLSGFHVFKTFQTAQRYMKRFTRTDRELIIVEGFGKGLRKKPTNSKVWLARELFLIKGEAIENII